MFEVPNGMSGTVTAVRGSEKRRDFVRKIVRQGLRGGSSEAERL